jgi:hypothetical protein
MFGIDAVHGHSNMLGAVIFPHNIGLGAAHDPELVRRIGVATAEAVAATGIDWTFAPTLAVPQDVRWGRSYEGFSQDPALVGSTRGPRWKVSRVHRKWQASCKAGESRPPRSISSATAARSTAWIRGTRRFRRAS